MAQRVSPTVTAGAPVTRVRGQEALVDVRTDSGAARSLDCIISVIDCLTCGWTDGPLRMWILDVMKVRT